MAHMNGKENLHTGMNNVHIKVSFRFPSNFFNYSLLSLMCYSMKKCSTVPSQKRTCPEKRQRDSSGGENGHREGRRQTEVWSPVGAITEGESSSICHIPDPIPRYLADVQESGSLLLDCGRSRSVKGTVLHKSMTFIRSSIETSVD